MGIAAVKCARKYTDDIEFYCEDSGRADKAYLFKVVEAVIDAGATTVNIPDTTGYSITSECRWPTRWRVSRTAQGR